MWSVVYTGRQEFYLCYVPCEDDLSGVTQLNKAPSVSYHDAVIVNDDYFDVKKHCGSPITVETRPLPKLVLVLFPLYFLLFYYFLLVFMFFSSGSSNATNMPTWIYVKFKKKKNSLTGTCQSKALVTRRANFLRYVCENFQNINQIFGHISTSLNQPPGRFHVRRNVIVLCCETIIIMICLLFQMSLLCLPPRDSRDSVT